LSVKIRLRRIGAKKHPFYRLVVADTRSPRDGKFIEILGTFDPMTDPVKLTIDQEKIKAWLKKGARPSDTGPPSHRKRPLRPRPPLPLPSRRRPSRRTRSRAGLHRPGDLHHQGDGVEAG